MRCNVPAICNVQAMRCSGLNHRADVIRSGAAQRATGEPQRATGEGWIAFVTAGPADRTVDASTVDSLATGMVVWQTSGTVDRRWNVAIPKRITIYRIA